MKKIKFTVLMVMSVLSLAAEATEFKFEWKGTVPAVTTYINKTISFNSKFDIKEHNSLAFVEQNNNNGRTIKLITMSEF